MNYSALLWLGGSCQAVSIPSGDAASQDALSGAAVKLFEDLRAQLFSEEVLSCLLHDCVG
jgi:hypothetical protein